MTTDHGSAEDLTLLGASKQDYPTSPDDAELQPIPWNPTGPGVTTVSCLCPEFTDLCPKTGQPDFGSLVIEYEPNASLVESKSLKMYLFSFRNHGSFHETVIDRIGSDLVALLEPRWLTVRGEFLPRGGISIHPTFSYREAGR
jgi:7-cyano-7-deazaguanine reductase